MKIEKRVETMFTITNGAGETLLLTEGDLDELVQQLVDIRPLSMAVAVGSQPPKCTCKVQAYGCSGDCDCSDCA